MADDWEDWDDDNFSPVPVAGPANGSERTKGELLLAKAKEVDTSKFEGEDEGDEEVPAWKKSVPEPQQKKEVAKKSYEDKGKVAYEQPLDDPIAEKLRLSRLQEQSDLSSAKELFGAIPEIDLETFAPKSAKDYEELGRAVAAKYIQPHEKSANHKLLLKSLVKSCLASTDVQCVRDLESCLAGIRSDKLKDEKAAAAAKKGAGKKKTLNVGRGGGSAGLDDYQFDDALDDGEDFM